MFQINANKSMDMFMEKKKLDVDQKHTKIIILWNTTNYKENPYELFNPK